MEPINPNRTARWTRVCSLDHLVADIRGTVRFLRRYEHSRGQAPSFGGVAETFDARNRGAQVQAWIFDQVSSGAAERKQETNAPSRSGDDGRLGVLQAAWFAHW